MIIWSLEHAEFRLSTAARVQMNSWILLKGLQKSIAMST
jgi:hypothetical protein